MGHERTIILFTLFMIGLVAASAGVVAFIG